VPPASENGKRQASSARDLRAVDFTRGAADMKGSIPACSRHPALRATERPRVNLEVSFSGDEETIRRRHRLARRARALAPDYVVVMEGGEGSTVCCGTTARCGSKCRCTAHAAHARCRTRHQRARKMRRWPRARDYSGCWPGARGRRRGQDSPADRERGGVFHWARARKHNTVPGTRASHRSSRLPIEHHAAAERSCWPSSRRGAG